MKLKHLHLENFRCHTNFDLDFNDKDTIIVMPNYSGKTTIIDSIMWVLTGKPLTGEKNYSPKPMKNNEEVHGLDSIAEVTFDNGYVMKKVFSEKWEKKRGSNDKTFTGNKTEYFINDVPYTEREYNKKLEDLIGNKEMIQSLLNPAWWCANKPDGYGWEKRRECLLSMLDIDESNIVTEEISNILMGQTTDEAKKRIKAQLKAINSNILDIPTRIDEINNQLQEAPSDSIEKLQERLSKIENEKSEATKAIANIEQGNEQQTHARNAYNNALSELNNAKAVYSTRYAKLVEQANKPVHEAIENKSKATREHDEAKKEYESLKNQLDCAVDGLDHMSEKLKFYREEYAKENAKAYVPNSLYCPTCNQAIPQEQLQKAQEEFNINKSNKLEELVAKGKEAKAGVDTLTEKNAEYEEKVKTAKEKLDKALENLNSIIIPVAEKVPTFEETPEYATLSAEVMKSQNAMNDVSDTSELVRPYKLLIESKTMEQGEIQKTIAKIENAENLKERIKELKDEERKLSEQYSEAEYNLHIVEQYVKDRLNLLSGAIENKFKSLRFRMWKENIGNDGISDCCDVLMANGIPYASGSTSEKIIANLELINVLSDFWGVELFALVDNAEAIQEENRPNYDMQTVWAEVERKDNNNGN